MQRRDFLRYATRTAAGLYLAPTIIEPIRRFWPGADFGGIRAETVVSAEMHFSRELLMQSVGDVEERISDDLMAAWAAHVDRELLYGIGSV